MIGEAVAFLLECMRLFAQREPALFLLSFVAAVALGALCWWACTHYTRLWNLGFHATLTHHALCGAAALLTIVFALTFFALSQAKEVARIKIAAWHRDIRADIPFSQTLYATAYNNARQAGLERFDPNKHFPPGHPKSLMPLNHEKTRIETSKLYGDAACANFRQRHPFLARVIWPSGAIPLDVIIADMRNWFARNPNGTYQLHRGIDLAAEQINKALEPNTPRVVSTARRYATLLFLLVQAIPFSLIGYAAYRDLKEVT
jgi:hypothetical protein